MYVATEGVGEFDAASETPPPSLDPLASIAPAYPWKEAPPVPAAAHLYPRARPKPRRLRGAIKGFAKLVLTIAILGGVAYTGWRVYSDRTADEMPAALQSYVDGDGVPFKPPFETVSLRLPAAATLGRDVSAPAQRWNAHAPVDGGGVDVISLDPAKLRAVSGTTDGLDTVGLGIVAADLGAEITDVETVEVGGRDVLEASAETKTARVKIGVVAEGTNVLALVVTSPEGSGPVLRAVEQSLSFERSKP